jgi:hypothetical protein
MDKVNEDFKAWRGLPDVLARTGPQKLGRRFVRNPPSGLVSWFKKWFKR